MGKSISDYKAVVVQHLCVWLAQSIARPFLLDPDLDAKIIKIVKIFLDSKFS